MITATQGSVRPITLLFQVVLRRPLLRRPRRRAPLQISLLMSAARRVTPCFSLPLSAARRGMTLATRFMRSGMIGIWKLAAMRSKLSALQDRLGNRSADGERGRSGVWEDLIVQGPGVDG